MSEGKFEVELFIHKGYADGSFHVLPFDGSEHGSVLLGSQIVTLDIPDKDVNKAEVEMLEKKVTSVRAIAQSQIEELESRIQELQFLECK